MHVLVGFWRRPLGRALGGACKAARARPAARSFPLRCMGRGTLYQASYRLCQRFL
ncbi:hypothetical protein BRPE64_ACDS18630 [Caballeronia insecticola]|uniref:Uncharacterized protein n=1 Tax=Caballeronia insecticola TaxID=758793 RepID=R4WZ39_9BURK|nr:hypothetical protein BRPE64_ACDS18630 [Caballeronia insecticola]